MGYLRLTLAWCVFISHLDALPWLHPKAGEAAVACFFVLSGYILAHVYHQRFRATDSVVSDSLRFFSIRWLSLAGPYLLVVGTYFLLIVGQSWRTGHPYRPLDLYLTQLPGWPWWQQLAFAVSNISMVGLNAFGWRSLVDPPAWTMGVESVFWLCAVLTFRRSQGTLWLWALALLVLDVAWGDPRSPLLHAECFVLGVLVWRSARLRDWAGPVPTPHIGRLRGLGLAVAAGLLLLSGSGVALVACPLLVAVALPWLPKHSAADPLEHWLGQLSYTFYLVHVPCLNLSSVLLHRQAGDPVTLIYSVTAWALSMLLAALILRTLPRPDTLRLYSGWSRR